MKKLLLTLTALLALSATVHGQETPPAQVPPMLFRIPSSVLAALNPNLVGNPGDAIQVIVGTQNPKVLALRVTLIYVVDGVETTLVSQRPVTGGFDLHSFTVPNYQVAVKSVTIQELSVLTEQAYTF